MDILKHIARLNDGVQFFHNYENWGDISKVNYALLFVLNEIRASLPPKCYIQINYCYDKEGHEDNSYHSREGKGGAVDFVVVGLNLTAAFSKIYLKLEGMNLIYGLGVYPEWRNPGFHLDLRDKTVFWVRRSGEYHYFTSFERALFELNKKGGQNDELDY